jgi:predicted HicB family RNase H-like nuclease
MSRNVKIFTSATITLIRKSAEEGKSAAEIADLIGSTAASVRVKCSQFKIKLSHRGRPVSTKPRRPLSGQQKLVIRMEQNDYAALKKKAARMGKSSFELVTQLLEAIIRSNIYEAVLDERNDAA